MHVKAYWICVYSMYLHHQSTRRLPGETKHWRLDGNVVILIQADAVCLAGIAHHHPRGQRDEVAVESLADEREGARGAQVAFNHLHVYVYGY
ncbi:hypothetical protein EON63_15105 [archaeon]|nr:MAG: hypothetical protein EON63_15105 [archaeon]